jgi:hypothetical protein
VRAWIDEREHACSSKQDIRRLLGSNGGSQTKLAGFAPWFLLLLQLLPIFAVAAGASGVLDPGGSRRQQHPAAGAG